MHLIRRITLILGLLAVQLSLAGDGAACALTAAGADAMSGMDMGSPPAASADQVSTYESAPAPVPCNRSNVPGSCRWGIACGAVFLAAPVAPSRVAARPVTVRHEPLSAIGSLVRAPDVPPPRA